VNRPAAEQRLATAAPHRPRARRLGTHVVQRDVVQGMLDQGVSPEQTKPELRKRFPNVASQPTGCATRASSSPSMTATAS
jgi:hypothetical protein